MKSLKIADILKATGGELLCGDTDTEITEIITDSRKVKSGCLFVPLKGETFDGHDFLDSALSFGAIALLTSRGIIPPTKKEDTVVIRVDDTLAALGNIAAHYRSLFDIPALAITGSVGKTTTKEMCYFVLCEKYNVHKNKGNFNNEIGVPLTLFEITDAHDFLINEMGMSGFGEIDNIAKMVKPDCVIMTNIGVSHIELLGSQENIYKAKSEFLNHLKPSGTVILNGDDDILMAHKDEIGAKVITFGIENKDADICAYDIRSFDDGISFKAVGMGHDLDIKIPALGEHNVKNALAAIAAGVVFGVDADAIKQAFLKYEPDSMRMFEIKKNGITIINDCYNAAPDSMAAALKVLGAKESRKVAVLGDMACLGEYSYSAHKGIGTEVTKNGVEILITIGENARYIGQSAFENGMDSEKIYSFDTVEDALKKINSIIMQNDVVLVKASRVMQLERVTEFLTK